MILVDALFTAEPMLHAANNPRARQASRWGRRWCHCWSDTHNVPELLAFAARLGLRAEYIQRLADFPHFDLIPSKRALAVRLGAKPVNLRDWLQSDKPETPRLI